MELNQNDTLQQIEDILSQIDDYIKNRTGTKNIILLVKINTLNSKKNRLLKIRELLKIEKYKLAFIGQIGVGKTTAISQLLSLTKQKQKSISVGEEKKHNIYVWEEILTTGSGRTTLCEVEISQSDSGDTFFEIETFPLAEVEEMIDSYCHDVWKKSRQNAESENDYLSTEKKRAIRNIVKLDAKTADILANQHTNFHEFREAVLARANLESRKTGRLIIRNVKRQESKAWIKKTFFELNVCKTKDLSMPKRIHIRVEPEILKLGGYRFNSIVDTSGLDEEVDRKDIAALMRENHDTICILAESFTAAPKNIIGLLERYLTEESFDIDTKIIVMILPKKGEPEKTLCGDRIARSREEGINERKNQVLEKIQEKGIKKFLPENVIFYDALYCFDDEHGQIRQGFSNKSIENERMKILETINDLIIKREDHLRQEVTQIANDIDSIREGKWGAEEFKRIDSLKKTIQSYRECNCSFDFTNLFSEKMKQRHIMTFRALNHAYPGRYGNYEPRELSIYFDSKSIFEEQLRKNFSRSYTSIKAIVDDIKTTSSSNLNFISVLDTFIDFLKNIYEDFYIKSSEKLSQYIKCEVLSPQDETNELWLKIDQRWGRGNGYRDDVLGMYGRQFSDMKVQEHITSTLYKLWQSEVFDTINNDFFPDSDD